MKFFLVILAIFLTQNTSAQLNNSVLASSDWFKFSVDATGVFKIDKSLLQRIGVSTNGMDPKNIQIFGNGGSLLPVLNSDFRHQDLQENAIFIQGEEDGSFDGNDFILFYAKGPHDWIIDTANKSATHRQNIYSDKAYYFITVGSNNGKRIAQKTPNTNTTATKIISFDDFTFYEKDELNLLGAGTQWFFDDNFNIENTQTFTMPFSNASANENISIRIRGVSNSQVASEMEVKANSEDLYTIPYSAVSSSGGAKANTAEKTGVVNNSAEAIKLEITFNNNGNPSANAYLDFIEIVGKKRLISNEKQFSFRSFEQLDALEAVVYQIKNEGNILGVWDVSDFLAPQIITNEAFGTGFIFKDTGGVLKEYIVLNSSDFYIPETVENAKVLNQNLHALTAINYLVVTTAELATQAQRLADYHQENSGLSTKVVVLEEIYNEFASGSKDITAIDIS